MDQTDHIDSEEAPIKIPNFELTKELGRGGMSRVYLARSLEPKREVAIKIVSPGSAPDMAFLASLKQEGDTVASLSHDNVITVYACGVIDKHYYMAMEVLPGGDLAKKVEEGMSPDEAVEVMIQISSALGHAHKKGILHRDIKPENVMFHESGKAVLVDFGIAKEADTTSSFTQVGAVVGTPHYMSPERCLGKTIDARSDLYAMGVMFFEMLTGHKVFEGRDTFAVSYAHVYEPVPPLPTEHARFQPLVNKLLAKDPNDRFANADELIEALKKFRAGAAASAEPATRRVGAMGGASPTGARPAAPVNRKPSDTSAATLVAEPMKPSGPGPVVTDGATVVVTQPQVMGPAAAAPAPAIPVGTPTGNKAPLRIAMVAAAVIAVGALGWMIFAPGGGDKPVIPTTQAILDAKQRVEMEDKLNAARSMTRINNFDGAEDLYITVLEEFDCSNEEARSGLRALNEGKLTEIVSACE